MVAHHIIPRRVDEDDSLDNLLLLCFHCHIHVDHRALYRTALESGYWAQKNPSQVGEALALFGAGNAALNPEGNSGKRPETDHNLNFQTRSMVRVASERIERLLNGGQASQAA